MKLIVGLGNPGKQYDNSRHNIGFDVVDRLARQNDIELSKTKHQGRYGGGMIGSQSGYNLNSTIGQPDAGVLGDGDYVLNGGFWGGALAGYRIYLPLIVRGS